MPKCDFKATLLKSYLTWVCSPLIFLHIFRTTFLGAPLGGCFWNLYDQCYMNGMNWNEFWNELKLLCGCSSFCQGWWIRGWLHCFQISSFYPFLNIFLSHYNVFKACLALDDKWVYLTIYFGGNFFVSGVNVSVVIYRQILLNITRYCQILFD